MTRVCTACGSKNCRVVETRLQPFQPFGSDVVKRRRRCMNCFQCWWTVEITEDAALKLAILSPKPKELVAPAKTFTASQLNDEDDEA